MIDTVAGHICAICHWAHLWFTSAAPREHWNLDYQPSGSSSILFVARAELFHSEERLGENGDAPAFHTATVLRHTNLLHNNRYEVHHIFPDIRLLHSAV